MMKFVLELFSVSGRFGYLCSISFGSRFGLIAWRDRESLGVFFWHLCATKLRVTVCIVLTTLRDCHNPLRMQLGFVFRMLLDVCDALVICVALHCVAVGGGECVRVVLHACNSQ